MECLFSTMSFGNRTLLGLSLEMISATDSVKAVIGKIQDCYRTYFQVFGSEILGNYYFPDPHSALPTHMHSAVCHMGIDYAVMGYVTDKSYKQRST